MKFFGFILSTELNYFVYYGENMCQYLPIFFNIEILYSSDFNLIKLLLSLEEGIKYFSLTKIIKQCSINKSHLISKNNNLTHKLTNDGDIVQQSSPILSNNFLNFFKFCNDSNETQKKELNLAEKIIEFFTRIIKDNSSLYLMFEFPLKTKKQMKIEEEFEEYFLKNEEKAICDIIRKRIINYSICEQNIFKYSDFKNINNINIFDEKKFQKIFNEMTNKNAQNDGQIKFSLKNEFINQFDLDYILNPIDISDAQKYIIEFKNQEISLLNNYFYKNFEIYKNIDINCFYHFFYFNDNIEQLMDFCTKLLGDKEYSKFSDIFFFGVAKLIIVFMYVDKNIIQKELLIVEGKNIEKFYNDIKEKLIKLLDCLKIFGIENNDEEKKKLYEYLETNILQYLDIKIEKGQNKTEEINSNKKKEGLKVKDNKKLKEKYKQKFKQKKYLFLEELTKDISLDKTEDSEKCILCHLPLIANTNNTNGNDNNDIFGAIGSYITDNFIEHCKYISLKNSFKKYNNSNNDIQNLSINLSPLTYYKNNKNINTRIFSCNHKLHFKCYNQIISNISFYSDNTEFDCPLCKKMGNIFIPFHNLYNSNCFNNKILNGFKISDFFNEDLTKLNKFDDNIFVDGSDINIQNTLNSSILFVEKEMSSNIINENIEEVFNRIIFEFSNFMIFYHIVEDSKSQIEIWTNFILSLRILLKCKFIDIDSIISKFLNLINFFNTIKHDEKNLVQLFFNDLISKKIDEYILILLILFDFEENCQNQIFVDLIHLFLPFISILSFIKNIFIQNGLNLSSVVLNKCLKLSNFNHYVNNSNTLYKEDYKISLNNLFQKIYIFKLINNRKIKKNISINENIKINPYNEFSLNEYEDKPISELVYYQKKKGDISINNNNSFEIIFNGIDNKIKIEKIFQQFSEIFEVISLRQIISKNLLLFGTEIDFKFIPIEKNLLEHVASMQKKKCIYCGKDKNASLLCLLCGEKICDNILCIPDKKDYIFLYKNSACFHSMACHRWNNAYISDFGNILFYYKNKIIYNYNGIYLNQFGEGYKYNNAVSNNYVLIEKNYEKMEKMFINYTYRKN